jgi:hypothetical protein
MFRHPAAACALAALALCAPGNRARADQQTDPELKALLQKIRRLVQGDGTAFGAFHSLA